MTEYGERKGQSHTVIYLPHYLLTESNLFCIMLIGERYSSKIKYRFLVLVPKRQILPCAVMRIIRSALTCLSVPFTAFFQ